MTIHFEGADFDSVDELIEYKKKMGLIKNDESRTNSPKQEKAINWRGQIKTKEAKMHKATKWSNKDKHAVKDYYTLIHQKGFKFITDSEVENLGKIMNRSPYSIKKKAFEMGLTKKLSGTGSVKKQSKKSKNRKTVKSKRYYNQNSAWSKHDISILKDYYKHNMVGGRIRHGSLTQLSKILKRTTGSIGNYANFLNITAGHKKKININEKRETHYMTRKKPLHPEYQNKKATITQRDYGLPRLNPLTDFGINTFLEMLKRTIKTGRSIKLKDVIHMKVELHNGFSWTESTWKIFCTNFQNNLKSVKTYLATDSPIRLQYDGQLYGIVA